MKKLYLTLSALSALIPLTTYALGIQVMIDGRAVVFEDVSQSAWFAEYVRAAAEAGIVSGYRDNAGNPTGRFGPSNSITIAEALKIAVEGAGYDEQEYETKVDSGVNHWSSPYVAVAKAENFAVITSSTRLDTAATRGEVAAMFAAAFRVPVDPPLGTRFTDVTTSTKYADVIETLTRDGVLSGDTGIDGKPVGTFRPKDPINRAEVAKVVTEARTAFNTPGEGRGPDTSDSEADGFLITYTDDGFSTGSLRVKKGDTVSFRNDSTSGLWVASNPHPAHTGLNGFDAGHTLVSGETYIYTFNQIGTWGFHNHLHPSHTGTIVVEE